MNLKQNYTLENICCKIVFTSGYVTNLITFDLYLTRSDLKHGKRCPKF
jgi:hypothetical protein